MDLDIGYDESEYLMTAQDVDRAIELLESYNVDNWKNGGSCIWEFDDEEWPYSEHIRQDIESLRFLRGLMDKYDLDVYFYDSY